LKKITLLLSFIFFLIGCQNNSTTKSYELSSDNGILDLSEFEQEEQRIDKFLADIALDEALEQRVVKLPENLDNLFTSKINLAIYARNSKNRLGESIYTRLKQKYKINNCKNFLNNDQAQRFFLIKGGPKKDYWRLDSDGDGFACDWNPNFYRNLKVIF